jgi:hypothetical protein
MKILKNHNIYEVWNESMAESVLVDHKPTKQELLEICKKEGWQGTDEDEKLLKWIRCEKFDKIYTKNPTPKNKSDKWEHHVVD